MDTEQAPQYEVISPEDSSAQVLKPAGDTPWLILLIITHFSWKSISL